MQPFAMVLHELATNAAKHGALSVPGGALDLRWRVDDGAGDGVATLRLRWAETGGPPLAAPPDRCGFGSRVVEATVRGQLGGAVERRWEPSGLVVEVAVPLARLGSDAEPGRAAAPEAARPAGPTRPPGPRRRGAGNRTGAPNRRETSHVAEDPS